jgi:hypothetical protein
VLSRAGEGAVGEGAAGDESAASTEGLGGTLVAAVIGGDIVSMVG